MTGTNDQGKKETLSISRPSKLSLTKTVEGGKVKQNFQHGRSKTVTVEVRRTRNFMSNDSGTLVEVKKDAAAEAARAATQAGRQRRGRRPGRRRARS